MDPTITRLAEMPEEMTIDQVAYVLARSPDFVTRASTRGHIESRADLGRGSGLNHRYVITRAAVLLYLIRSTRGERTLLLGAIGSTFPDLHEWARTVASGGAPQLPATRTRKAPAALHSWHPDQLALFESPHA
jgi:hypothetical protein